MKNFQIDAIIEIVLKQADEIAKLNSALQNLEAREREKSAELEETLRELKSTQTQLIESEKMSTLGQFIRGIAHEINKPITFIYANIRYAEEYFHDLIHLIKLYQKHYNLPVAEIEKEIEKIDIEFLVEDLAKILKSINSAAECIREIVLPLRHFGRLCEAEKKLVNIHEGIDWTLLILNNRLIPKHGKEISIIKEYGNVPLVDCYPSQLNQALMNIVVNAIDAVEEAQAKGKFSQSNESEIPTIKIKTEVQEKTLVTISISDNGMGMTEEVQSKIFEPFFTTKPVDKGTGIGLAISYQIVVVKHSGRIFYNSQLGEGSEFIIEIPIQLEQSETRLEQAKRQAEKLAADLRELGIDPDQNAIVKIMLKQGIEIVKLNSALQKSEAREREKSTQAREREKSAELEETLRKLELTQTQLIQSKKTSNYGQLIVGIADEINSPINFIYANITPANTYFNDLMKLIKLYQKYYNLPVAEIQQEIEEIEEIEDIEFIMEDLSKILKSMEVAADRIREIVWSLRYFSGIDYEEMYLVNIDENIDNILPILNHQLFIAGKKISLIKEYGNVPLIDCYVGKLNQVFTNILENAIYALQEAQAKGKFSQSNESEIPRIKIKTEVREKTLFTISISDNGMGMTEEVHAKIFEPFFTTKSVGQGNGLGLAISYQIVVEKHGGRIFCNSKLGEGSEFVIEIPIQENTQKSKIRQID